MKARLAARVVAVLAASLLIGTTEAAIETIALTGDPTPEGNGNFGTFSFSNATAPVLNNRGELAFWAGLFNNTGGTTTDTGIYLYDGTALKNIVREDASIPEGGGRFNVLSDVSSLNDVGQVAFDSSLRGTPFDTNAGTYLHNGNALVRLARRGDSLPDGNGMFSQSLNTTVNVIGHVRIKASLSTPGGANDNEGMYLHNGSGLVKLARENETVPEGNGVFNEFFDFKQGFNDADQVAFQADLRNTSGGFNDNHGIYLHNGTTLVNLARENTPVPEGNGVFGDFSAMALVNSAGQVVMRAGLRGTSGGSIDNQGVYLHNGSGLVKLAREGENVPEGEGQFASFGFPVVNDAGQAAFFGDLRGNFGGTLTDTGVYFHNGSGLVKYVREYDNVPEGNGRFEFFNRLHLNDAGLVAFSSTLRDNSGGVTDDRGLYLTDGFETIKVAREGDALAGTTITFLDTTGGYAGDLGLRKSFNDFGQLAFRAAGANGGQGIFLFTPEIRWRATTSGAWDNAANWTLGLPPGAPHNVTFNPAASQTIAGPASSVTLRSLTVGDGAGAGNPTLNLQAGSVLSATDAIDLNGDGTLGFEIDGTGAADIARLTSNGMATLDGDLSVQLTNGFMPNAGDVFNILTAMGGITGTFDTTAEELPALAAGRQWQINYGANNVALAVVDAGLSGNFNGDDMVDGDDLAVWRGGFGVGATHVQGDADGDADIDGRDFLIWQRQVGGAAATALTMPVPEPATLRLLFMCLLAASFSMTRRCAG